MPLSPFGQYGGIHDNNVLQLFNFAIQSLNGRVAYLHLIEGRGSEIGLSDAGTEIDVSVPASAAYLTVSRTFLAVWYSAWMRRIKPLTHNSY